MIIKSSRLLITPLTSEEKDSIHRIWTSQGVRRFLWDNEIIPIEKTEEIIDENLERFERFGHGIWSVYLESVLVGFVGYWPFRQQQTLELLFGVADEYWNRGIATEACQSILEFGFEKLAFTSIDGSTDSQNNASIRVMTKLGMEVKRRSVVEGIDTIFFSVDRPTWREKQLTIKNRADDPRRFK